MIKLCERGNCGGAAQASGMQTVKNLGFFTQKINWLA
jgi:hypothetical protein